MTPKKVYDVSIFGFELLNMSTFVDSILIPKFPSVDHYPASTCDKNKALVSLGYQASMEQLIIVVRKKN